MSTLHRAVCLSLFTVLALAAAADAQETYFGKNKVRYKDFDWTYIESRHFDIYFYEDAYPIAEFSAAVLESAYVEIARELDYKIQRRVPVFLYNSHNDFQQTNIISSLIPEGVGGFTEAFKNRIVLPFDGSYEDLRHVIHHELTHAATFDLLYGNMLSSLISRQRLFQLPLWYAEGYAEYSSRHGWDYFSDMFVRDATINNYLTPPEYLGGFLAYKQGQAMVKYLADTYGEDKLGKLIKKGKAVLTMSRAMKDVIGKDETEFFEEFSKEMKRRYWPDIAQRKEVPEISKQLTKAREDGSYYNEKPEFSPDGGAIAIFTDKYDYTEIVLISPQTGEVLNRLVKSARSADLESLHSFVSGMSFSPDGRQMVFVAKSNGKPTLKFLDTRRQDIVHEVEFGFYNIVSPAWSPDGSMIAFAALRNHTRDIYVYNLNTENLTRLTSDRYDDNYPSWLPDSRRLVFSSDRPHPETNIGDGTGNVYASEGSYMPGDFTYGSYNLFTVNLEGGGPEPLLVGPGQNTVPKVSPDGKRVAFISNRNGIDNIYIAQLDSSKSYAVTDILTGVRSLSWSPDGDKIAFSAFNKGAFDVFVLDDFVPQGDTGVLAPTEYIKGTYQLLAQEKADDLLSAHKEKIDAQSEEKKQDELAKERLPYLADYEQYQLDSIDLAAADTSAADSSAGDSTVVAAAAESDEEKDKAADQSGVQDGEYVFVAKEPEPFDSVLIDIPDEPDQARQAIDTSIIFVEPERLPDGTYPVKDYKVKFTPDYVGGGFQYDTFFGLRGQSVFVFSDYLGNHQIAIATDLVNTIDQTNIQAYYFFNKMRTNIGVGIFHTKNYYLDPNDFLFSDRFYGIQAFVSRPFSTFSRVEAALSQYLIDRQYYDFDDERRLEGVRNTRVTTGEISFVTDNIIWGNTGPLNGRRAKLTLSGGIDLFDSGNMEYSAGEFDYRKYWHLANTFSFAFRFSGGASFGSTPKLYFLGGTTNWVGNRTLDAKVYDVENLYFADVVTPMRSVPYYELYGTRYALINTEFRFPLVEYFAMRFPLPLVLSRVNGAIFADMGAAWTGDDFKGGTSQGGRDRLQDIRFGFGFGWRLNLANWLLLRYDIAWGTDFYEVSDRPSYYFSFGADF